MNAIKLTSMIDKAIKISYSIEISSDNDTLIFIYSIGGKTYAMQFENITAIETERDAKQLITALQANIQYHINELENKLQ